MSHTTTSSLIDGLTAPGDASVWLRVDERFRPRLMSVARRFGLGREDAADVAQETLVQVVREARRGRYDRDRGRLSAWVFAVARHRILDLRRASSKRLPEATENIAPEPAVESELEQAWRREEQRDLLARSLAWLEQGTDLRGSTLTAFRLQVFEGWSPQRVAEELSISVGTAYWAKHQCLKRLRERVERLRADEDLPIRR